MTRRGSGRARRTARLLGCGVAAAVGIAAGVPPGPSTADAPPAAIESTSVVAVGSADGLDPKDLPSNYTDYQIQQTLRALEEIEKLKDYILQPEDLAGIPRRVLIRGGSLGKRFLPGVYDPDWPHWNVPKGEKIRGFTPFEMLMALRDAQRYGYLSVKLPEPGDANHVKEPDLLRRVGPADRGKPVEQKFLGSGRKAPTNPTKAIQGLIGDGNSTFRGTIKGPSSFLRNGIVSVSTEGVTVNGKPIDADTVHRAMKGKLSQYEKSKDATLRRVSRYEAQLDPTASQQPRQLVKERNRPYTMVTGTKATGLSKDSCSTRAPSNGEPQRSTSSSASGALASYHHAHYASTEEIAVASAPCGPDEEQPNGAQTPALGGLTSPALRGSLTEAEELGGIDFSTMELRYLSVGSSDSGSAVDYAFRARDTGGPNNGTVADGIRGAVQASDAFFVWLSLPKSAFWVNLSPTEPDRIIDPAFGRTQAGRILLESDLMLKRTDSRLMDPKTRLGARYWKRLRPASDGNICLTYRVWIVPGTAKVRETEDSIYIVDAPLDVKMRQDIGRGSCAPQSKATKRHNSKVYRQMILPKVVREVNTAAEYAPLRRVYLSRVAAEWYRQQSAAAPSAYSDLIDSGNIDKWRLRGSWRPRDTYRDYLRAYNGDEFSHTVRVDRGSYIEVHTYRTGGVDFTRLFEQSLTAEAFETLSPGLADTVEKGLRAVAVDPRTKDRWLGGTTRVDAPAPAEDREPAPEPEPAVAASTPDDPWSRDYAPYVVPLMVLAGVGLVGVAILRERRRQHGVGGRL